MKLNLVISKWGLGIVTLASILTSVSSYGITLEEFLGQVKGDNKAFKAAESSSRGSELQTRESDLFFSPKFFAEARIGDDDAIPQNSFYRGLNSEYYGIGIQQQFSFGLQAKLSYDMSFTKFKGIQGAGASFLATHDKWIGTPKLELNMPLWGNGFGKTAEAQSEATRAQALAAKYNAEANKAGLLAGAEATYWKLSAWQDVVRIQGVAKDAAQNIFNYVTRKKNMNLGEDADVKQARALVEARTLEVQVASYEEEQARREFNKYLNKNFDAPVSTLDKVNYSSLEQMDLPAQRPGNRPDVEATNAQLAAAKAAAIITRERNRPTFDLYGSLAFMDREPERHDAFAGSWNNTYDTTYVGAKMTIPLNFGGASDVKKGADLAVKAAELNKEYAYYSQDQDWVALKRQIQDAGNNLKLLGNIEQAQKEKLEAERSRLRQGRTTTYQVLLFEQDYTTAAISRVKSAAGILGLRAQVNLYNTAISNEGAK